MTLPLLATKLTAPPTRLALTERQRLAARLEAGRRAGARLTLISAPAGSGKTTVARAWLEQTAARWAWLTLDEADNDPVRFLSYLLAAFGQLLPGLEPPPVGLLNPNAAPEVLLAGLINELAQETPGEGGFLLVLDDYHRIRAAAVHALLAFLLEHLPPRVQVALLTRQDPPLEVARLRASRQMTELRAADLRFSRPEIDAFLRQTLQLELSAPLLDQLEARTEGWAAAVQLAGLSLQGAADPAAFLDAFSGSHRYVIDYLLEEVMGRLPDDLRAFLTDTCLLGELCAPLADAVRQADDSAGFLARLERANLFLTPLDEQRQWYRYHPLFAEVLRLEVTAAAAQPLHRRAAGWLAQHGRADEAVQHALAGADFALAQALIVQHASAAMQAGRFATVDRWLTALPEGTLAHSPALLSYRAWGAYVRGDRAAAEAASAQGLARPPEDAAARGRLLALQAWLANLGELPETEHLTLEALERLTTEPFFSTLMLATLSHAQNRRGEVAGPTRLLTEAYTQAAAQGRSLTTTVVLSYLLSHLNRIGRRREGIALGEAAAAGCVDRRGQPLGVFGPVLLTLSLLYYEGGELEAARRALALGQEASRRGGLEHLLNADGIWTAIRLALADGDRAAARALIAARRGPGAAAGFLRLATLLDALAALTDLADGDLAAAARWADACGLEAALTDRGALPHFRDVELLALADVRLAQGAARRALPLLVAHIAQLRAGGRVPLLIAALIRLALAQAAQDHPAAADAALTEALTLAAPEGFVQAFRDAPAGLTPLLRRSRAVPAFSAGLLADFGAPLPPHREEDGRAQPIEALSPTEARILALLAAGQSNAEIAAELVVSVGTAKWHVHHILRKLGVSSRLEAAAAAHALGLVGD